MESFLVKVVPFFGGLGILYARVFFHIFFLNESCYFRQEKKKDQEEQPDGPRDKESLPLQPLKKHLPTKINEEGGDITKEFMLATPIGSHELLIKRILLI